MSPAPALSPIPRLPEKVGAVIIAVRIWRTYGRVIFRDPEIRCVVDSGTPGASGTDVEILYREFAKVLTEVLRGDDKMKRQITVAICSIALAAITMTLSSHAIAQQKTVSACRAEWRANKADNQAKGITEKAYVAQCRAGASPAQTTAAPAAPPPAQPAPTTRARTRSAPAQAPIATGNAVFPSAVSSKYSSDSAGKARFYTCLDQYRVNKANGGNGGLKWIEKGDGYYSECNKRLKGQT